MEELIKDFLNNNPHRLDYHNVAKMFGVTIDEIIKPLKVRYILYDNNFKLFDQNDNLIYQENGYGECFYDDKGNRIKKLFSDGRYVKLVYDENNNLLEEYINKPNNINNIMITYSND